MPRQSIVVENLSKSYDNVKAVHAINFNVDEGEIFGLIGPDGAGKTTIFRMLVTLMIPDEGKAIIEGFDSVSEYKKIRKIIGYMPGKFSLYHDLTVEENLKFYATIFGTTIQENYYLIKDIYSQIEPFRKRLAGKLSGGMKQKLALSCALIHKPSVLFLDEPTTGVDAVSRKEFWEMLKHLKEQGITILVSTPYMDEAVLCDRVALIMNGNILSIDTPQNIIDNFQEDMIAIRTENIYRLLNDLREYSQTKTAFPFGRFVHYTDKSGNVNEKEIYTYLQSKNYKHIEMNPVKANIEDCFIKLMKQ